MSPMHLLTRYKYCFFVAFLLFTGLSVKTKISVVCWPFVDTSCKMNFRSGKLTKMVIVSLAWEKQTLKQWLGNG